MNDYLNVIRNHYADFRGRARRREYWMFVLINFIISLVLTLIDYALGWDRNAASLGILSGLYALAVLIPGLALSVRRLHDIGRSGWWLLIGLIPLVGALVLLIFTLLDSEPGPNKWGPNPKGVEAGGAAAW